jgi:hypothetical protein
MVTADFTLRLAVRPMSKGKGKHQSAEQAPPPKDHSLSEVKKVTLMLYAQGPFPVNSTLSKFELNRLVWRANDLLDKLNEVCEEVARQRKAGKRSPEKNAQTYQKARNALPDVVPYNAAVMFITGEKHRHVDRAKTKFETVLYGNARAFGYAAEEVRAQRAHWGKNGMPRDEVIWRRTLYNEKEYQHYRIAERAKKRQQWSKDRRVRRGVGQSKEIKLLTPKEKASMRELIEEGHELELERTGQAKKQKKVKALLKTAQTGEIE